MTSKKFGSVIVLSFFAMFLGVTAAPGLAQVRMEEEIDAALPLPLQTGARWLRLALLAPLQNSGPVQAEVTDESSPQIREIEEVQKRLGGSIVRGHVFDDAAPIDEAELRRALTDIEKRQLSTPCAGALPAGPQASAVWPRAAGAVIQYSAPSDPLQAATEQLRGSARNLDLLAADLEDAGNYKAADRLRASANKLRREARSLRQ